MDWILLRMKLECRIYDMCYWLGRKTMIWGAQNERLLYMKYGKEYPRTKSE